MARMNLESRKKIRFLERKLLKLLLDKNDSPQRKRYIKKRIYGETPPKENPTSIRKKLVKSILRVKI